MFVVRNGRSTEHHHTVYFWYLQIITNNANILNLMLRFSQFTFKSLFSSLFMFSFIDVLGSTCPIVAATDAEDEKPTNVESQVDVGNSGHCRKMGDDN